MESKLAGWTMERAGFSLRYTFSQLLALIRKRTKPPSLHSSLCQIQTDCLGGSPSSRNVFHVGKMKKHVRAGDGQ